MSCLMKRIRLRCLTLINFSFPEVAFGKTGEDTRSADRHTNLADSTCPHNYVVSKRLRFGVTPALSYKILRTTVTIRL
jgi:hypothetical protein